MITVEDINLNIVPKAVDNVATNLTDASSKAIGQTLSEIWYLTLGGPIHQAALKRDAIYAVAAEKFKEEILQKVEKIPKENLIEPDFQVASTAFNDSKFCLENDDLREMFANLISSASDSSTATHTLPIFSDIIRKMTSRDASNLKSFGNVRGYPIAKYRQWHGSTQYVDLFENVFLQNKKYDDLDKQSISVDSLCSLGLVIVTYDKKLDPGSYADFYKTKAYIAFNDMCQQHNRTEYPTPFYPPEFQTQFSQEQLDKMYTSLRQPQRLEVIGGMIELTDLGSAFKRICLGE